MIAAKIFVLFAIANIMIGILYISVSGSLMAFFNTIAWHSSYPIVGILGVTYPIGVLFILLDKVEDTHLSTHPVVIRYIQVTSQVCFGTTLLNLMLFIVGDVYFYHGEIETAWAFNNIACISLICMLVFLTCYGFYIRIIAAAEVNDDDDEEKQQKPQQQQQQHIGLIMTECSPPLL
jgi:hypothetical protein